MSSVRLALIGVLSSGPCVRIPEGRSDSTLRLCVRVLLLSLLACAAPAIAARPPDSTPAFAPAADWRDTEGRRIQAHGGGILKHKGRYYWFGENMDASTDERSQSVPLIGVSCYSSTDLRNWRNHGLVLPAVQGDPQHDLAPANVIERPKVIYNRKSRQFVMWMHVDKITDDGRGHYSYEYARAGVAVADSPTGPYRYLGSVRPDGLDSRDMTVFQDDDGKAYLVFATRRNSALRISLLAADYLKPVGPSVEISQKGFCEAPAMFRNEHRYFLLVSACTGWRSNPALYAVASSPLGPWTVRTNPCSGAGAEFTFHSQGTFVLPVSGRRNAFIFMADRWNPKDLSDSRHVWLPLLVNGDSLRIRWFERWDFSVFDRPWD